MLYFHRFTHAVAGRTTTTQNGGIVLDTSFTAIMNLPLTEYRPDQLQIIVSLTPNNTAPVVADFPASYQYTVMFSGLMPGTSYTYTVRVVRHSDITDIVDAFVGSFTIVVFCKLLYMSTTFLFCHSKQYKGAPNFSVPCTIEHSFFWYNNSCSV